MGGEGAGGGDGDGGTGGAVGKQRRSQYAVKITKWAICFTMMSEHHLYLPIGSPTGLSTHEGKFGYRTLPIRYQAGTPLAWPWT